MFVGFCVVLGSGRVCGGGFCKGIFGFLVGLGVGGKGGDLGDFWFFMLCLGFGCVSWGVVF